MKNDLKQEAVAPKLRQVLIETDGQQIWVRKAECSKIELVAICNMVVSYISKEKNETDKKEAQ